MDHSKLLWTLESEYKKQNPCKHSSICDRACDDRETSYVNYNIKYGPKNCSFDDLEHAIVNNYVHQLPITEQRFYELCGRLALKKNISSVQNPCLQVCLGDSGITRQCFDYPMEDILSKFLDKQKLDALLKKSKAVVSGSSVLQCILGERYSNTDLDIFYSLKESNEQDISSIQALISDSGYVLVPQPRLKGLFTVYPPKFLDAVDTFEKQGTEKKIQLIKIDSDLFVQDYIKHCFVLDCVKNVYNGETILQLTDEILKYHTTVFNGDISDDKCVKFIFKYLNRGFNVLYKDQETRMKAENEIKWLNKK